MNIVHLVVVETLSTLWNLEEPFAEISSFSLILGTKNLVKVGTQQDGACDGSVQSQDRGSEFHDSDNESGGQAESDNFTDGDSCGSCSTEDESSSSSSCSGDLAYDDPTSSSTDDGSTRSESISEGS